MKKLLKKSGFLLFFLLAVLLFSCSARIDGVIRQGGAADIRLDTSLEPGVIGRLRQWGNFLGASADAPMLDGPEMNRFLAASPGVRSVSLKNTSPSALSGGISLSNAGDFLASKDLRNRFITYTEGRERGTSSIIISLDRASAPELISRFSPEVEGYLSTIFAPAVSGQVLTKREYLDQVASFHGRSVADEIAAARVRAFIEFPGPVTRVLGGSAEGKRAEFNIPLTDILVLDAPLRYEVYW